MRLRRVCERLSYCLVGFSYGWMDEWVGYGWRWLCVEGSFLYGSVLEYGVYCWMTCMEKILPLLTSHGSTRDGTTAGGYVGLRRVYKLGISPALTASELLLSSCYRTRRVRCSELRWLHLNSVDQRLSSIKLPGAQLKLIRLPSLLRFQCGCGFPANAPMLQARQFLFNRFFTIVLIVMTPVSSI